jgi:uncharacterized protein (TIGR02328 family)
LQVLDEMTHRHYNPNPVWYDNRYRGRTISFDLSPFTTLLLDIPRQYPEHDGRYLRECLDNLHGKGKLLGISISALV